MKQLLKLAAAPATGMLALALTSITTPAAAAKYARDPFLPAATDAYAYQPKGGLHRARKPVQ
jgi:hypothetical protein